MMGDQIGLFDVPEPAQAPEKAPKVEPAPRPSLVAQAAAPGTFIVECTPTDATRAAIAEGYARFEEATRSHGPSDDWDKAVIDQAIRAFARQGQAFSANDVRPLLPAVRTCLISRRFIVAQHDEIIEWTGTTTPSTLPSTKAAKVQVYRPTDLAAGIPLVRGVAA